MDIEEFYEANEARRRSAEIEFGSLWTNASGARFELSWVEDTGELYLMMDEPATIVVEPVFGDTVSYQEPLESLQVQVITVIAERSGVEERLEGWETAMGQANSLSWLYSRLGVTPS